VHLVGVAPRDMRDLLVGVEVDRAADGHDHIQPWGQEDPPAHDGACGVGDDLYLGRGDVGGLGQHGFEIGLVRGRKLGQGHVDDVDRGVDGLGVGTDVALEALAREEGRAVALARGVGRTRAA